MIALLARIPHARLFAVVFIVVFLLLAGTGVSSAAWTAIAGSTTGSVTAATTSLTVTGSGTTNTVYKFAGAPNNSNVGVRSLLVTNTGTAPLTYSISATGVSGTLPVANVTLVVWKLASTATCTTTVVGASVSGTLAAPPVLPAPTFTAARGESFRICAMTRLGTSVAESQGQALAATLVVTGTVGTSWNATAGDGTALTQSVYQVPNIGAISCNDPFFNPTVTLSWAAPAAAASGSTGALAYRVVDASTGAVVKQLQSATSVGIGPNDLATSPATLLVQVQEAQYGTTSIGTPVTLTKSSYGALGTYANCP